MFLDPNNKFQSWVLDPNEVKEAANFSDLTRKLIQNELSIAAHEKIALTYDPLNPLAFALRDAELQGKIGLCSFLLELYQSFQTEVPQNLGE